MREWIAIGGWRREVFDEVEGNRVLPVQRDDVARDWIAHCRTACIYEGVVWIVNRNQIAVGEASIREVTGQLLRSGDACGTGRGGELIVVVRVEKEERAVSSVVDLGQVDRTADGAAEPVAMGIGQRTVVRIREPVVGVECSIPTVEVAYAVNLVGAALGNHVDDRAARIAEFRAEEVGRCFHFLYDIR